MSALIYSVCGLSTDYFKELLLVQASTVDEFGFHRILRIPMVTILRPVTWKIDYTVH